jgi:hypothetical protein
MASACSRGPPEKHHDLVTNQRGMFEHMPQDFPTRELALNFGTKLSRQLDP